MSDAIELREIESPPDTSPQQPQEDPGQEPPETESVVQEQEPSEEWPELLPRSWHSIPSAVRRWGEREADFTAEEKKEAWDETAKIVKDYSDELVKRWKEEIDTLLVYAGLFSAVLTAHIVEAYTLLSPPPPDPVLAALQQISLQLSSFSVNPPFLNSTHPSVSQTIPPSPPTPRWAVWLNALWFSSLIFSLSAASVGIMVKQWLNEYSTGLLGDSRQFARLRQHRLQNLERWHVAEIVAILPVLLQIALALFFGGLLVFLWILNSDVAAVASALVGSLFAFTIGSSLIPVFRADCCYLSPPVYLFVIAAQSAKTGFFHSSLFVWNVLRRIRRLLRCSDTGIIASSDSNSFKEDTSWMFTWRGRELKLISKSSLDLDATMVTKAYASTMDQSYLNDYATICISDFPEVSQVADCYRGLVSEMNRHQLDKPADIPLTIQSDLWLAIASAREYAIMDSREREFIKPMLLDRDGLPDMDRFWEDSYDMSKIPTGASSWRDHLWSDALILGNTSVAYAKIVRYFYEEDYRHCSNAVRRRAVQVVEKELREHGQKAEGNSLKRCSFGLRVLLRWVGASSSAKDTQPEDTETAKAIRALTRHELLLHFKYYTTEAGKTLSLYDNTSLHLIWRLRKVCEDQAPDFMTHKLVDALVHSVYEVHQEEFQPAYLWGDEKNWILQLSHDGHEGSSSHAHIEDGKPSSDTSVRGQ